MRLKHMSSRGYRPLIHTHLPPGGRGDTAIYGYIGMCNSKGCVFLAFLVMNRIWLLHSSLELNMFFGRSYFFLSL